MILKTSTTPFKQFLLCKWLDEGLMSELNGIITQAFHFLIAFAF